MSLLLPAPAEQAQCAEASGEEREGGWERNGIRGAELNVQIVERNRLKACVTVHNRANPKLVKSDPDLRNRRLCPSPEMTLSPE